jgi:hypothetical protein
MAAEPGAIPEIDELPDVNYVDVPEEVEGVLTGESYIVDKMVKLTFDGDQFLARVPTEIADELNLTEGESRMEFNFQKPLPNSEEEPTVKIELCP